jgi:chromosome segregation ATPase
MADPLERANERATNAEAEHRKALAEIESLKLQLQAADAAIANAHASCEQKIKKYDSDLVYSGQTAASLRRQLSDAIEEKARAVAVADEVSKQEFSYKTTIANLQSSKDSALSRNTALQLELKTVKDDLSNAVQSCSELAASSSTRIAELATALSEADATIREQSNRISMLQKECQIKEDSLASASANITSWSELCASLKRQIEERRISECSFRENVRLELEEAAFKVQAAEDLVKKTQTECSAALKAMAQTEASAVAQAKSDSSALKTAEDQILKHMIDISALRVELENVKGIQLRLEAETSARIALEKRCAAAEESASTSVSTVSTELQAMRDECDSLKAQLHRAVQSSNASASAKDSLKAEVDQLSAQLHIVHQEMAANQKASKKECESLKAQLTQALAREKEHVATKDALTAQLAMSSSAVIQERGASESLRTESDESRIQIAQLNEHIEELRVHVAKAAQTRLVQDEACAALKNDVSALQLENRELKASLEAFEVNQVANAGSQAQIKRLLDDKKALQEQVESLMHSAKVAIEAENARVAAQDLADQSAKAAQRYKCQIEEMRIRLDETTEATASLTLQAERLSLENTSLKEQVVFLKEQVTLSHHVSVFSFMIFLQIVLCSSAKSAAENNFLDVSNKLKVTFLHLSHAFKSDQFLGVRRTVSNHCAASVSKCSCPSTFVPPIARC